jgi:adenine-specific DNA-methyltransferase
MNIDARSYEELKRYYNEELNVSLRNSGGINDVPTPIGCIEEILMHVPTKLWANPTTTVFDPCCGNGNWHLVAWHLIRQYCIKNDNSSITSRFTFNDVDQKRLECVASIFSTHQRIMCSDFLAATDKQHQKQYDIVMANPPYARIMEDGKRSAKNHNLIGSFIETSLRHVKQNGYMIFLVPDSWMSLSNRNSRFVDLLTTECKLLRLNIHHARKWFPKVGSTFTWFIAHKTNDATKSTTMCVRGIHSGFEFADDIVQAPSNMPRTYLPLVMTTESLSIISKTLDMEGLPRYKIETSSDLHKHSKRDILTDQMDIHHPYRILHTLKKEIYSTRPHKHQEGYKVFITLTNNYTTLVDNCGMTQSVAYVRCKDAEEAQKIKKIFDHDLYVFLNNICRWGNFNNIKIIQKFPIPSDEKNVYQSFKIEESEKEFISRFLSARTSKSDK